MSQEILTILLSVVGVFISLGLVVNGFFLKDLISSLKQVELGLAIVLEKFLNVDGKLNSSDKRIDKLDDETTATRKRVHELSNEINKLTLKFELSTCNGVSKPNV